MAVIPLLSLCSLVMSQSNAPKDLTGVTNTDTNVDCAEEGPVNKTFLNHGGKSIKFSS